MATETRIPGTDTRDHFQVFGLPRKLNIDVDALQQEFYRQSRKLHPDLFVNAPTARQVWSMEQSSRLNDAFRTLKDPITRTRYLLELEGVKLEEQSSSATQAARESGQEKLQAVPPELLEEVFELNMQLQEMKMGGGDPEVRRTLESQRQHFEAMLSTIGDELRRLWDKWDDVIAKAKPEGERAMVRDEMVTLLNRRNYVRNLVRDVNAALEGGV